MKKNRKKTHTHTRTVFIFIRKNYQNETGYISKACDLFVAKWKERDLILQQVDLPEKKNKLPIFVLCYNVNGAHL